MRRVPRPPPRMSVGWGRGKVVPVCNRRLAGCAGQGRPDLKWEAVTVETRRLYRGEVPIADEIEHV